MVIYSFGVMWSVHGTFGQCHEIVLLVFKIKESWCMFCLNKKKFNSVPIGTAFPVT